MKGSDQLVYWMAIAHLPRWRNLRINELVVHMYNRNMSLSDFFDLEESDWSEEFNLNSKEIADINNAKNELPNSAFIVEDLLDQNFELIPIVSDKYSQTLKDNLKTRYSPPLLYVKGNRDLLNEECISVVGSRDASDISLDFTKNIVRKSVEKSQVIVSGFAKGVDRLALDEAISNKGMSIIVLPQGIMTFASGIKRYYAQIVEGDALIVSTFHPKAPWSVGLAMARNVYIYGLSDKIYVAESGTKGGTWSGVIDGLKKEREIYIRKPGKDEKNGNSLLILKGAKPLDIHGNIEIENSSDNFEEKIKKILKIPLSASEIKEKINLDISVRQVSNMLSELEFIVSEKRKGRKIFMLKSEEVSQIELPFELFDDKY